MDSKTAREDTSQVIEGLREEIRYLREANRIERIEARAWMREIIAHWIEATEESYSFKELAQCIREIPTEIGE